MSRIAQAAPGADARATDRAEMVERQLAGRKIRNRAVLDAFREVPREAFVPAEMQEFAYADGPLPIGEGQTISQPYIVALMAEIAGLEPGARVLEIGAGSGYAAAILSRVAARVVAIERHPALAEKARAPLSALGYDNVEILVGDGARGRPEDAPFDVIIVSAGGPRIPQALKDQLAIGGRLVIPVGGDRRSQRLTRLTRLGDDDFREEDFGGVAFVPLIGLDAWEDPEAGAAPEAAVPLPAAPRDTSLADRIAAAAEPFDDLEDDLAPMIDRFAGARVICLGEASHGTSEFYRARAAITKRLVERHGFNVIGLEADWPDAAHLDAFIRGWSLPKPESGPFARFPRWMWRNAETLDFVQDLKELNEEILKPGKRAGIYGLDIYSLSESIAAVLDWLDDHHPDIASAARERYGCLAPWLDDPAAYGRMATRGMADCEAEILTTLKDLLDRRLDESAAGGDEARALFSARQNARVAAAAEEYYRAIYRGAAESWNRRDRHMVETLENVLENRGPDSKAVIWAHNSHLGDARATEMGPVRNEVNVGQLVRERFGDAAVLIGCGTDRGTVAAADNWDSPMKIKSVRPSHEESYERQCLESGEHRFLLDLRNAKPELTGALGEPRLERFIGVIYRPETELMSHYSTCILPEQFDAWIWFEETEAVLALDSDRARDHQQPELYPFGV